MFNAVKSSLSPHAIIVTAVLYSHRIQRVPSNIDQEKRKKNDCERGVNLSIDYDQLLRWRSSFLLNPLVCKFECGQYRCFYLLNILTRDSKKHFVQLIFPVWSKARLEKLIRGLNWGRLMSNFLSVGKIRWLFCRSVVIILPCEKSVEHL